MRAVRKGWEERDLARRTMREHSPWDGPFTDSNTKSDRVKISARWKSWDMRALEAVTRELRERLPGKRLKVASSICYVSNMDGLIRVSVYLVE